MSKIIIGLVGQVACGKEAVKKYIAQKYNTEDCKFSNPLRDVVRRLDITESRENLQKLSTILRGSFGEDILAKVIAIDASKLKAEIVIIDGVRRMADIKFLKDLPNFYLIKVDADEKTRYERMKARNENAGDSGKTFEQFLTDQNNEAEKEIPIVMDFAKISIDNNGTLEELYSKADRIIAEILSKY
ncbi:MAG: AAA family ATPase [Candidatus Paceibacterota bacterium]|jgi:dephospho-CoA kinase